MKWLISIIIYLWASLASAQGTVNFTNAAPTRFFSVGTTLAPTGWFVGLLASTTNITPQAFGKTCITKIWQAIAADGNYTFQFQTTVGATAGRISNTVATLSGINTGTTIFYYAVVWTPAAGATFPAALANGVSGGNYPVGVSVLGQLVAGAGNPGASSFGTAPLINTTTIANNTVCPPAWDPLQLIWD